MEDIPNSIIWCRERNEVVWCRNSYNRSLLVLEDSSLNPRLQHLKIIRIFSSKLASQKNNYIVCKIQVRFHISVPTLEPCSRSTPVAFWSTLISISTFASIVKIVNHFFVALLSFWSNLLAIHQTKWRIVQMRNTPAPNYKILSKVQTPFFVINIKKAGQQGRMLSYVNFAN